MFNESNFRTRILRPFKMIAKFEFVKVVNVISVSCFYKLTFRSCGMTRTIDRRFIKKLFFNVELTRLKLNRTTI